MKQILVPEEIAEKITLYESLLWVGFSLYFTDDYTINGEKIREDYSYQEDMVISCDDHHVDIFFTEKVCKKYGLPKSYLAEYVLQNNDYPTTSYFDWETINKFEEERKLSKEDIEGLIKDRKESDIFEAKQITFDKALEDYLEIIKSKLFIELKQGNIKAYGREVLASLADKALEEDGEPVNIFSFKTEELYGQHSEEPKFEPIQKDEWTHKSIDWDLQTLRSDNKCYCHILIDTNDLFELFPEIESEDTKVYSINGTYVIDSNDDKKVGMKKGRKPKYNWPEIHAEIIRRFSRGELSKYQNAFIIDMQEWCKQQWNESPSDTNLKNYISPFYKVKKESEKSKNKVLVNS